MVQRFRVQSSEVQASANTEPLIDRHCGKSNNNRIANDMDNRD